MDSHTPIDSSAFRQTLQQLHPTLDVDPLYRAYVRGSGGRAPLPALDTALSTQAAPPTTLEGWLRGPLHDRHRLQYVVLRALATALPPEPSSTFVAGDLRLDSSSGPR